MRNFYISISTYIILTTILTSPANKCFAESPKENAALSSLKRQVSITKGNLDNADKLLQEGIISKKEYEMLINKHQKARNLLHYYKNKDVLPPIDDIEVTKEMSDESKEDYKRLLGLYKKGIISEHELLEAELNYKYSYNKLDKYTDLFNLHFNPSQMVNPLNVVLKTPLKMVTSKYGFRTHPITGLYSLHGGIDIAAPAGSPVSAYEDGFILRSTKGHLAGNFVQISHGGGFSSLYLHLKKRAVKANEYVKKGQVIGYVGSTGRSTGNHLHFEIRKDNVSQNINYLLKH